MPSRTGRTRVHDVERPGEPTFAQVVEHGSPDPASVAAHPDHGNAVGVEQRIERPRLSAAVPRVGRGLATRRRGGVEPDVEHAVGELLGQGEARVGEHPEHGAVLEQHLGHEAGDATFPGRGCEVLQQEAADAETVAPVLDEERDLGSVRPSRLRRRDGEDPTIPLQDHGQGTVTQDVVDVLLSGVPPHGEEPQPERVVGDPFVECVELVVVVDGEQPDDRHAAVCQQDVGGARDLLHGCHRHSPARGPGRGLHQVVRGARPTRPAWVDHDDRRGRVVQHRVRHRPQVRAEGKRRLVAADDDSPYVAEP